MAYPLPSPFDRRISRLRNRLQHAHGQAPHQGLRNRLLALRARRDIYRSRHRPPSPVPFSALEESTVAGLNRNYADTQAELAAQEFGLRSQYGFDPGFQADPFSRARLLQQHYEQAQRGSVNSYAASGQLYSGALSEAQGLNRQSYLQNYDAERRAYQDALNKIAQERLAAQRTREEGISTAKARAIEDALKEPPDPTEAPPPSPYVSKYRHLLQKKLRGARKHHNTRRIARLRHRIKALG